MPHFTENLMSRYLWWASTLKRPRKVKLSQSWEEKEWGMRMVCSTHLLMQHMATCHWMQLTGLDKFLAHETQLTGGWNLQNRGGTVRRVRNLCISLLFMPMILPIQQQDFTPEQIKVQIQTPAESTCIFPVGATDNPADKIMVSPCTPSINPLPPHWPPSPTSYFSKKKSLTCEDLPGYETWAEGKNTGVLIWASGAGNKARIRPSGCGQKHCQSKKRIWVLEHITKEVI